MSYAFVPVGQHWINLDLVKTIELVDDPKRPGVPISVRVHYLSTDKYQDFTGETEVSDLVNFLRTHRAK